MHNSSRFRSHREVINGAHSGVQQGVVRLWEYVQHNAGFLVRSSPADVPGKEDSLGVRLCEVCVG